MIIGCQKYFFSNTLQNIKNNELYCSIMTMKGEANLFGFRDIPVDCFLLPPNIFQSCKCNKGILSHK